MHAVTRRQRRFIAAVLVVLLGSFVAWMLRGETKKSLAIDPIVPTAGEPAVSLREEEVRFRNREDKLAGVLVLPASPGPHPAVVFVHGSGSQDRNDWTLHPSL